MRASKDPGTMTSRQRQRSRPLLQGVALGALLLAVAGCGPKPWEPFGPTGTPLVWPPPPEQPRIMYLGSVSTEADMERSTSWAEGFGQLLFGSGPLGVLVSPYAVAVDSNGRLFVADSGGAVIHSFDLKTRGYGQFAKLHEDAQLQRPVALALWQDRLYVADSVLRRICVFRRDGTFLLAFGDERLQRPAGIACRADGTVYVSDAAAHRIDVFNAEGQFIAGFGTRGIGPGQFNFPTHLCVDRAGRLYVSDTLNYRVQVFGPGGEFVGMFGQQGDRPGNFAHPCGVAVDRLGHVYVTDRQFENVQVFNPDGRLLMAFGQEGSEPGEFWLPAGVFVDDLNRIYVADSYNKRIQIFSLLETLEND
jgi:DNA-binding beta-propeller fold protein YncE